MPHALLDLLLDMAAHYQAKADEHTMGTSDDATTE
jgi:hypothetical protein